MFWGWQALFAGKGGIFSWLIYFVAYSSLRL